MPPAGGASPGRRKPSIGRSGDTLFGRSREHALPNREIEGSRLRVRAWQFRPGDSTKRESSQRDRERRQTRDSHSAACLMNRNPEDGGKRKEFQAGIPGGGK
ncbi:hypothetical protein BDDG_06547 [Blastomyces dermatitidis ATCC 18188]|uniref:Uncharacterized protein n=1 Tax=Ajellomyces dermatitidis (strain ATCC 18188 / CBS 674.68) TaxID=653446 RepID=F2TK40_AJEDA|nr:hypothetical protein BDDG_06547 [Blastomyces dermatitidis ATCC 18188]